MRFFNFKNFTWYFLLVECDVNLMWTVFSRSERHIEEVIAFGFDLSKRCCLLSANIHSEGSFTSIATVNCKVKINVLT